MPPPDPGGGARSPSPGHKSAISRAVTRESASALRDIRKGVGPQAGGIYVTIPTTSILDRAEVEDVVHGAVRREAGMRFLEEVQASPSRRNLQMSRRFIDALMPGSAGNGLGGSGSPAGPGGSQTPQLRPSSSVSSVSAVTAATTVSRVSGLPACSEGGSLGKSGRPNRQSRPDGLESSLPRVAGVRYSQMENRDGGYMLTLQLREHESRRTEREALNRLDRRRRELSRQEGSPVALGSGLGAGPGRVSAAYDFPGPGGKKSRREGGGFRYAYSQARAALGPAPGSFAPPSVLTMGELTDSLRQRQVRKLQSSGATLVAAGPMYNGPRGGRVSAQLLSVQPQGARYTATEPGDVGVAGVAGSSGASGALGDASGAGRGSVRGSVCDAGARDVRGSVGSILDVTGTVPGAKGAQDGDSPPRPPLNDPLAQDRAGESPNRLEIDLADEKEMLRLYLQVSELSDSSGPIWCIGGLSFYEVVRRFARPPHYAPKQDPQPKGAVGYPFNPIRGRVVSLAARITRFRGQEATNILAKMSQRQYPVQLDDVWPEGFPELALLSGAQYTRSSQDWTDFEPTTEVSSRTVLSILERELRNKLEEHFGEEILDCISVTLAAGYLDTSVPSQMKLFQLYSASLSRKIPGIGTDPGGAALVSGAGRAGRSAGSGGAGGAQGASERFWVSCHMDERRTVTPTANDILRYLEGFVTVMDWKILFCNVEPQPGEIGRMAAKVLGPATVRLSLASALLIKCVYVDPLAEVAREIPVYGKTHSVEVSMDALTLELLRTQGKGLTREEMSRSRCSYYSEFTSLVCGVEARAAASSEARQLISEIHDCLDWLYAFPAAPDLLDDAGGRDFLAYFASLVGQGDITEVRSITAPFMRAARTAYLRAFQEAGGLRRMKGRKRGARASAEAISPSGASKLWGSVEALQQDSQQFAAFSARSVLSASRASQGSQDSLEASADAFAVASPAAEPPAVAPLALAGSPVLSSACEPAQRVCEREMRRHKSLHVPVCILAACVAAIKVLEEAYPLTFHSHFGRLAEQKGLEQVSKLVDPQGVIFSGIAQLLRVKGWERWMSCEIQPGQ